jgi:protein-tyrosine phosphatase
VNVRVCFVCLGNICRSPTAEGIMLKLVSDAGLDGSIEVASAGTAAYHAGEPADERSAQTALQHGIELRGRARQFEARDLARFDYVLALDSENLKNLRALGSQSRGGEDRTSHIRLLREFEPGTKRARDVPDPYYGGDRGFERVFDICEASCRGLLSHIIEEHGLG